MLRPWSGSRDDVEVGAAVLTIGLHDPATAAGARGAPEVLALPVGPAGSLAVPLPAGVDEAELAAFLEQTHATGAAGSVQVLPRPLGRPARLLLVGVGEDGSELGAAAGWRAAGAALA